MASLQGLPPLPKSLHGLMTAAGSAQWREMEKIHSVKSSIQQDIPKTNTIKRPNLVVENGIISLVSETNGEKEGEEEREEDKANVKPPKDSIESAIAFLRHEMVALRQLDTSILCQLWSLNEALHEFKLGLVHAAADRLSETNSTCSSYSLDQGLDGITEEESDYENYTFHMAAAAAAAAQPPPRIYENIDFVAGGGRLSGRAGKGVRRETTAKENGEVVGEGEAEDYLEPQSWKDPADSRKAVPPPQWNLPPQLSLELLSLPPAPPLPLSSPPHSPPIPVSTVYAPMTHSSGSISQNSCSTTSSSRSSTASLKVKMAAEKAASPDKSPRENKWPGYLLLNTSTTYESTL